MSVKCDNLISGLWRQTYKLQIVFWPDGWTKCHCRRRRQVENVWECPQNRARHFSWNCDIHSTTLNFEIRFELSVKTTRRHGMHIDVIGRRQSYLSGRRQQIPLVSSHSAEGEVFGRRFLPLAGHLFQGELLEQN